MTVAELIGRLRVLPQDAEVYFEVLETLGVEGVRWDEDQHVVWLRDD